MALKPKPFRELLDFKFEIPPYQRGYRWDVNQVDKLLDDLLTFINNNLKHPDNKAYYCLQPIAVVKKSDTEYIVVDGQQRLTTLYILLQYLYNIRPNRKNKNLYALSMPSRDIQNEYLLNNGFTDDARIHTGNIDIFYMRQAYLTIKEWFEKPEHEDRDDEIRKLFSYVPTEGVEYNDARVIWYEIDHTTALRAFRRLNYGKIPLTSTELVKALILQSEPGLEANSHSGGATYRRALEWDAMEHALQDPYLWGMLNSQDRQGSHFELILDFVAERINNTEMEGKYVRKSKELLANADVRDDFNYNVIEDYLSKSSGKSYDEAIDFVWSIVRNTYNMIINWYVDPTWYHLIGLWRQLKDKKENILNDVYRISIDDDGKLIDRPVFTQKLISEIGKLLKSPTSLNKLRYHESSHRKSIIRILTALNVIVALREKLEGGRLPFHLLDAFNVTSLEHIHPQNITSEATYSDFSRWLITRGQELESLSESDFIHAVKGKEGEDNEKLKSKAENLKQQVLNALARLRRHTSTEQEYKKEENKEEINEDTKILDKLFGDLSGISEDELHSIQNMALVDQPTNSALSNNFLDKKRDILLSRHEECDISNSKEKVGTYAPPATRMVFSKEFSRKEPGDMRLWTRTDRENYFNAIQEAYNYFVNS